MNIVAIIPARKGSKSIKDKNIVRYKGEPLIYHSIRTALSIKLINRTIVSTNSKKYQLIAKKFGADVPFIRPNKISADYSTDREFLIHAYEYLKVSEGYKVDIFVLLRPTTPNRKKKVVEGGIKYFLNNFKKYDSMRSASYFSQPPEKFFYKKGKIFKGYFNKKFKSEYFSLPRQKFKKSYLPNGYIDILKPNVFMKKNNTFGKKILAFITSETNDIDKKTDLLK